MGYKIDAGMWNSVFAVPADVVDKHLKLAGKEQLKVLLFLLRYNDKIHSVEEITNHTGIDKSGVEDAIDFWIQQKLIKEIDAALLPDYENETSEIFPLKEHEKTDKPEKKKLVKPDSVYIAKRITESADMKFLMHETENTLGKTISPALSSVLIAMHDDYGLPVEIIVMIIHYAKSVGKTGTSYIDSVGKNWASENVFTIADAEKKLHELDEKQMAWRKVENILGIFHRAPSPKEEEFSYRWIKEWNLSSELITEAYNRCIDKTGKLSMSYMNRILEKWHNKGLNSLDEIEKAEKKKTEKAKSYDIDEAEDLLFFIPPEQ